MKITVVIPSYNNSQWCERNLSSVFAQNYSDYRVIYINDASPDNTEEIAKKFIQKSGKEHLVQFISNETRCGAMQNLYNAIHSCEDNEIILTLDGDDWFAHSQVFNKINDVYSKNDVWITYGQYRSFPDNAIGCCQQIPENIINANNFRQYRWCSSHLRTFYAWLFKRIKKEDFLENEKFYPMTWDLAMMFPMLEMAGHRSKFIADVLYIYNVMNPLNDSKVDLALQQRLEHQIRFNKSKYDRI